MVLFLKVSEGIRGAQTGSHSACINLPCSGDLWSQIGCAGVGGAEAMTYDCCLHRQAPVAYIG